MLDLVFLAFAVRDYRRDRELQRLVRDGSLESLSRAVEMGAGIRDRLLLNLGNHYFERGLRSRAAAEVRAAAAYYREALRINPELGRAKKNFELARRVLRSSVPPMQPREPLPPDMIQSSEMPLKPNDI